MDLRKKLFTLLAIFCIVVSAGAVCAADVADDGVWTESQYQDDTGYTANQYQDDSGFTGIQDEDDSGYAGSQYNQSEEGLTDKPIIDPDYAHMEPAAGEPTNQTDNITGNATDSPVAENATLNATAGHTMLSTGNPILALLAVSAVLGSYAVIRRK